MAKSRRNWVEIEEEVINSPEEINYRAIAQKYGMHYDQVRNRARKPDKNGKTWKDKWQESRDRIQVLTEQHRVAKFHEQYDAIDQGAIHIALLALNSSKQHFSRAKSEGRLLPPKDLKCLMDVAKTALSVASEQRGDISDLLRQMVIAKLLPEEYIPYLIDCLRESDDLLVAGVNKVYQSGGNGTLGRETPKAIAQALETGPVLH